MVSSLREIVSLCQRYNTEFCDTKIFFRSYGDIETDQLLQRVNHFLADTSDRASRLIESIEPPFNVLTSAWRNGPQQWQEMVRSTATRLSIDPNVIERNFLNYIGLVGFDSNQITYDYMKSLQANVFDEKKTRLIDSNAWTQIDQTLQPTHSFSDVRNLLNTNERDLNILQYYFSSSKRQNNAIISLIDLLFNPQLTIKYSASTLVYVTLRDINLLGLNVFLNDTAKNSLLLTNTLVDARTSLTQKVERMNNEQSYLNNESMQIRQRTTEQSEKVEQLKEEMRELQGTIDHLSNGIKKLRDINGIVEQFQKFEESFLNNMKRGVELTYGETTKIEGGFKYKTTRQPTETDLQNFSDYKDYLDLSTLVRINSDFEDYRINIARLLDLLKTPSTSELDE